MKKFIISGGVVAAIVIIIIALSLLRHSQEGAKDYDFAKITTGNIVSTVSATGTLSAVSTVQVGTQVSGTIVALYADYNDKVAENQVLAIIDTIPLKSIVLDAMATLASAQAQLQEAQSNYDRNLPLYQSEFLSENDFLPIKTNLNVQKSAVNSARAALTRARQNLDYATIRSPIHGTILKRSVEVGQTVAASFATPTLFIIAKDLTKMEIQADVDESDIANIRAGEAATFQVPAFPDSTFAGITQEIYLQPTVVQNVVNYTVIVKVDNRSNTLLPGMTATVDFISAKSENVLRVPNAALYFQPTQEMIREYRTGLSSEPASVRDSSLKLLNELETSIKAAGTTQGAPPSGALPPDIGSVWYLNKHGKPTVTFFKIGITDGLNTRLIGPSALHPGMEVIIGVGSPGGQSSGRRGGFRVF